MRALGSFIGDVLAAVFLGIPVSLIISALAWFFIHVLGGKESNFFEMWRTIYIVLLFLGIATATLSKIRIYWKINNAVSRLGVPYSEVYEAVFVHQLHKQKDMDYWDVQWFKRELVVERVSSGFAKAMTKELQKRP